MNRRCLRALQGLVLAFGAPLGWLALRALEGVNPLLELLWHPGVYAYMLVGTAVAFTAFGAYVGHHEEGYRESALHDALTGLWNPRYFWRRLEEELAFAGRHDRPLSLLIADIDYFKRVNDRHGHAAGDEVLRSLAGAMMTARRRGDTVARVGGEEFAVIMPDTDMAEAVQAAQRMRAVAAQLRFGDGHGGTYGITLSVGVAAVRGGERGDVEDLYRQADAAMYRAKRFGRDCVATPDLALLTSPA